MGFMGYDGGFMAFLVFLMSYDFLDDFLYVIQWFFLWYDGVWCDTGVISHDMEGFLYGLMGFFNVIQHFLMWFNVFLMCYLGFSPLCGSAQKKSKLLTTETSNTCICAPFHSSNFFTFKQPRSNSSFPALQMLLSTEESLPSGVQHSQKQPSPLKFQDQMSHGTLLTATWAITVPVNTRSHQIFHFNS